MFTHESWQWSVYKETKWSKYLFMYAKTFTHNICVPVSIIEYYKVKSKTISSMIVICCSCDQQWENIPESFEFNILFRKKLKTLKMFMKVSKLI